MFHNDVNKKKYKHLRMFSVVHVSCYRRIQQICGLWYVMGNTGAFYRGGKSNGLDV